jgi:hypothetical protein
MFRKFALLAALTISAGVMAQNQPNPGAQAQQPPTVNVVTPPSQNIYVVSGGLYGTGLYPLPYLPMAPSQNAAPPQAGTAGISFNSPTTYSGPGYSYSTPLYYSNPASPYYNATAVVPGPETTAPESGRAINDFGPSYYVGGSASAAVAAAPAPSLGEVAAQYRSQEKRGVRTYTNADAWRLEGSKVIPGIIAANVLPAPPPGPPAETEQPQETKPLATPNAPPANPDQAPPTSQTPPPVTPEQTAPPAVPPQPEPSREPQATPPPQNRDEQRASTTMLPETSTLLPLLGAAGLLSGAAGLWIARFRR